MAGTSSRVRVKLKYPLHMRPKAARKTYWSRELAEYFDERSEALFGHQAHPLEVEGASGALREEQWVLRFHVRL